MAQIYLIRASRLEAWLIAFTAAAGGLILLAYLDLDLYALCAVLLLWLLGGHYFHRLAQASDLRLQFLPARAGMALEACGQTHFYNKYKVYPARWFAILKLIDTGNNRTLFLNSARFESDSAWRGFRRELTVMENARAD
ncbi:MAG: hypothetical protein QNJ85_18695 [Gammaproteobacteria bacterium]|nr:hypothetical protein [Gammaproteobacteria bacterium]